jgi:hypothetical protein
MKISPRHIFVVLTISAILLIWEGIRRYGPILSWSAVEAVPIVIFVIGIGVFVLLRVYEERLDGDKTDDKSAPGSRPELSMFDAFRMSRAKIATMVLVFGGMLVLIRFSHGQFKVDLENAFPVVFLIVFVGMYVIAMIRATPPSDDEDPKK